MISNFNRIYSGILIISDYPVKLDSKKVPDNTGHRIFFGYLMHPYNINILSYLNVYNVFIYLSYCIHF